MLVVCFLICTNLGRMFRKEFSCDGKLRIRPPRALRWRLPLLTVGMISHALGDADERLYRRAPRALDYLRESSTESFRKQYV